MNLSTNYMGLELKSPLIVSSSRLTGDLKSIRECVEAGASAIVLKSLFEEQIKLKAESNLRMTKDSEIYYWFPEAKDHVVDLSVEANLENYLNFVGDLKTESEVPIISSINCVSPEGWPKFASAIQESGADALELNIAIFPFDNKKDGGEIEKRYVEILKEVKKNVTIPVSVKLGYYFTNMCHITQSLVTAGADGLVLFNRFYRPDIDINTLDVTSEKYLSAPDEAAIPMRWIALLTGNDLGCDIAASTGVHDYEGVVKQILVGAKAVQLCSTLYINGINTIRDIESGLTRWMTEHKFESLDDFRGKSLAKQTTDATFERVQYMRRNYE